MRAAVLEAFKQPYKLRELTTPAHPTGHDLLVRVLAASYCHTDAVLTEGLICQELPRIGCREFAGRVVAMGSKVSPDLKIAIGDEMEFLDGRIIPAARAMNAHWNMAIPKVIRRTALMRRTLASQRTVGFAITSGR